MRILSIDCANKSLAIVISDVDIKWVSKIKTLVEHLNVYTNNLDATLINEENTNYMSKTLNTIQSIMDSHFVIKYINVYDITNGNIHEKIETRLASLKGVLNHIEEVNAGLEPTQNIDRVLIEYQMSSNDKSRAVSNALVYAYSEPSGFKSAKQNTTECYNEKVELIGPSLKSTVHFTPELNIFEFRKKYINNYVANKNHSKSNFLWWCQKHNININDIPKANWDDIADAFLMSYAWMQKNAI